MNAKIILNVYCISTQRSGRRIPFKPAFAEYFEVSGKTIERDFEYMRGFSDFCLTA